MAYLVVNQATNLKVRMGDRLMSRCDFVRVFVCEVWTRGACV